MAGLRVGLREDRVEAGDGGVRDEALRAVEDVLVALAPRRRPHRRRVRARARLGQRVRGEPLAATRASGRKRAFCSSVPASLSPSEPSSCTARMSPLVAQTFETSSIATSERSVPVPVPPYSSSKKSPKMLVLAVELDDVPRELVRLVDLGRARRDALARERADELADLELLVGQRLPGHGRSLGRERTTPRGTSPRCCCRPGSRT